MLSTNRRTPLRAAPIVVAMLPMLASLQWVTRAFGATPAATCAAAKVRAAGKRVFDAAKCRRKALLAATVVDPACLARVETRFASAIARADLAGSCPGTAAELDAVIGDCVDSIASTGATTTTPTTSTTSTTAGTGVDICCYGTSLCTQAHVATPGDCSALGTAAAGPANSVCDGSTGECVAPPAAGGSCCEITEIAGVPCLAGPSLNQANCQTLNGIFVAAGTCTPSGCTP